MANILRFSFFLSLLGRVIIGTPSPVVKRNFSFSFSYSFLFSFSFSFSFFIRFFSFSFSLSFSFSRSRSSLFSPSFSIDSQYFPPNYPFNSFPFYLSFSSLFNYHLFSLFLSSPLLFFLTPSGLGPSYAPAGGMGARGGVGVGGRARGSVGVGGKGGRKEKVLVSEQLYMVLFFFVCFVLFCFVVLLFCFVLFCFVLFCFVLFSLYINSFGLHFIHIHIHFIILLYILVLSFFSHLSPLSLSWNNISRANPLVFSQEKNLCKI